MNAFELKVPTALAEVLEILAEHGEDAKLIAGGTGLINLMKQHLAQPELLVSLHALTGLSGVRLVGDALEIGDRKSTRLNSSHSQQSRMPSSA